MITVLEGPDLAGKSTLARFIAGENDNREILKARQPDPLSDILEQYLRPIQDLCYEPMTRRPEMIVLDRWHVGETIYGPLLRERSRLTVQMMDYIDMVLQTFGCNFLYVTNDTTVLEARYDRRGDEFIKRDWIKDIAHAYDTLMWVRPHWVPTVPDYAMGSTWHVREPSPLAGPYIGPTKPRVLLLGDERNDERFIFPFVPARATSGHWLMGALREAEVNHMHVGIMNACEHRSDALARQWMALECPPVICLGRNAEKAWQRVYDGNGVIASTTYYLNHPQYERRFHYTQMKRYGQVIKDVMTA